MAVFDTEELVRRLRAEGVPHAHLTPVTVQQVTDDPALRSRKVTVAEHHGELGDLVEVGHTMRFEFANGMRAKAAPLLGQDTDRILRELGKSDQDIAALVAERAVFAATIE